MNLLGSPFRKYVNETVKTRQKVSGQKYNRSPEVISYLNSRNAWVKLASAVYLEQNRLDLLKKVSFENTLLDGVNIGYDLAIRNVLQGGLVSKGSIDPTEILNIDESFNESNKEKYKEKVNNFTSFSSSPRFGIAGQSKNPAYGVGGNQFGFSPMPGIVDVEISDLNRGSIKKSILNIKCHNREQFDMIDVLYLRLGYTVCLEWGWDKYIEENSENNYEIIPITDTLIDREFWEVINEDYSDFLDKIENKRRDYKGNYDGIIGTVSNFSWNFETDGTYNIKLEIISLGDVIESLKVNLPPLIDERVDLFAQSRMDEIKKNLKENYSNEDEFYNVLYPGLREQLDFAYDTLKNKTFQGNGVFNYNLIDGAGMAGDGRYVITEKTPLNIQIDTNQIADIEGGRNLMNILFNSPNWDWGQVFSFRNLSLTQELGREFVGGNAQHPGSVSYESYRFYDDRGFQDATSVQQGKTRALIVYVNSNDEWKIDNFLTSPGYLENTTPRSAYKYSNAELQSFKYYFLMNWFDDSAQNENTFDIGNSGAYLGADDGLWNQTAGNEKTFEEITIQEKDKYIFTFYTKRHFHTLFYELCKGLQIAGGPRDTRFENANEDPFEDLNEQNRELAQQLVEFQRNIEITQNKNKIYQWFYQIRKLWAASTYEFEVEDKWFFQDRLRQGGFQIGVEDANFFDVTNIVYDGNINSNYFSWRGASAITIEGEKFKNEFASNAGENKTDLIGFTLNGHAKWDEKVGFPTYSDVRDYLKEEKGFTIENNITSLVGGLFCDFVKMDYAPIEDTYFVRLGVLLDFIEKFLIPKKKGNTKNVPIIRIDTYPERNICYAIDNMISTNPRKCLIKNESFYAGTIGDDILHEKLFVGLEDFLIRGEDYYYGQLMNIYINFKRVEEIFDGVDENNQISLFTVLKAICNDINESLGDINNIEPVIDKDLNKIKLIDQTHIPNLEIIRNKLSEEGHLVAENSYEQKKKQTPLEVYGYNNNSSNFVRNVGMTTEISKNYATAITIGATANGEVPGMEYSAFSRWNIGIKDRFKEYLVDGETTEPRDLINEEEAFEKENEKVTGLYKSYIESAYSKLGLNINNNVLTINSDFISTNRNVAKNYFAYAQAKTTLVNYDPISYEGIIESSIGFLPINLKLEMDGLGGIRIYDFVKINSEFLPSNYPETLEFICTGVNHRLGDNDWITNLKTIATYIDKKTQTTSASS